MFLVQLPVSKELYEVKNDEDAPLEMHSINNKKVLQLFCVTNGCWTINNFDVNNNIAENLCVFDAFI